MSQYYCLVAGLVDYGFDADSKTLNYDSIREEILTNVSKKDRKGMELLMGFHDIRNIVNCSSGENWKYSRLGYLPQEDIELITAILVKKETYDADEFETSASIPAFIKKAICAISDSEWAEENEVDTTLELPTLLYSLYFEQTAKLKKGFLRDWSATEQNIRNITAAHKSRLLGIDPAKYLIGQSDINTALATNASPDFGLKTEVPYIDELISILTNDNIMTKERDIDLLRLKIIDEMNTFNYFNISTIMGYYIKIAMIERWLALDPVEGKAIFERIVKNLSTMDYTDKIAEELK